VLQLYHQQIQSTRTSSVPHSSIFADLDLTLVYDDKQVVRQVIPTTRVSALRAIISRTFGISVRKRRVVFVHEEAGGGEVEIGEGDGSRDVGWFISGRKGTIIIE
jgi:hypothetical protein